MAASASRLASPQHLLHLAFALLILGLMLEPVLAKPGWPMNHEGLTWKYRTLIYAAHFRRFDLLPIWSEASALGLGSPALVLYHKLFYFVSAACYLLLGSVKVAMVVALAAFSWLGVLGCSALLRTLGLGARPALIASACVLWCNYSYTDWVVRGAFAEYSAMMLIPWLFYWLAGVVAFAPERKLVRLGALVFPALYFAHSVLCFFAALPVALACMYRLLCAPNRFTWLVALAKLGGIFTVLVAPVLVVQWLVADQVTFFEGISVYKPEDFFFSLDRYLTGGRYVWGEKFQGYSVQLDVTLIAIAFFGLIWMFVDQRLRARAFSAGQGLEQPSATRAAAAVRVYGSMWLCTLYFGFLLTRAAAPFYASMPGFGLLQFPWRLLSFLAIASVCLAAYPLLASARWGPRDDGTAIAGLLLVVTYVGSPWLHEIRYAWHGQDELEAPLPATVMLNLGGFEYHPRVAGIPHDQLVARLSELRPEPGALEWAATGYSVRRVDEPVFEKGSRVYRVTAAQPTTVILPLAYAREIRIAQRAGDTSLSLTGYRTELDPRIHVDVRDGETDLSIRFPTLWSLFSGS